MKIEETFAYKNLQMILNEYKPSIYISRTERVKAKEVHNGLRTADNSLTTKGKAKFASGLGRGLKKTVDSSAGDSVVFPNKDKAKDAAHFAIKALTKSSRQQHESEQESIPVKSWPYPKKKSKEVTKKDPRDKPKSGDSIPNKPWPVRD